MNLTVTTAIALCFLTLITLCQTQKAEKLTSQNPCTAIDKCGECIQTKSCAWCSQPDFGPRCFQPSLHPVGNKSCKKEYIENPDSIISPLQNLELTRGNKASFSGSASGSRQDASKNGASGHADIVQIRPQRVKLNLRINEAMKIDMQYSQALDYPVDLYYLMDLSKSMEDDKENLSKLGGDLSEAMTKITSNFRLGFGSFVDKVVMPYVSTVPKNLLEPCDGCAAPYGFQNKMPLSTDTYRFSGEVHKAAVSGNLDAPEGGFDAIMQAVVCRGEIGWREKARRLLVFSTDAGFHYAGDGKLGGIVQPNDGLCHLDNKGMYTHSTRQDYPSISQINLKVKENAINVIFAVTSSQINVYTSLHNHIEGSSCGILSNDSKNVVDLVQDQYNKISSSVEMKDNSTSAVKITYYSTCLGEPLKATNKCDGLKVGNVVNFTAEIVVTQCPQNPKEWNQVIQIYPVGINESMVVDLQMLCDCPCEKDTDPNYEENSAQCNNAGTHKCGVCACNDQHFGRHCECSAQNAHQGVPTSLCRNPSTDNSTSDVPECSGRGNCVCGQCECEHRSKEDEQISGQYCECDNFSCDRHNGLLCSGATQGSCVCGHCDCAEGWTGKACDCRDTNDTCIPPGGGELCSGHGSCLCGQCECGVDENDSKYSGRFCDKCPTCSGRCAEFKECVQCIMYKTGSLSEEECNATCTFTPLEVEVVIANDEKEEHLCAYYDEDDCRFAYVYSYDQNNRVLIRAQQTRECPPQVYIMGIVLGVIAAIVLIGLALLMVWKMITTIHDRREFARFEKERMMAKWDTEESPLYRAPQTTFSNPTYRWGRL